MFCCWYSSVIEFVGLGCFTRTLAWVIIIEIKSRSCDLISADKKKFSVVVGWQCTERKKMFTFESQRSLKMSKFVWQHFLDFSDSIEPMKPLMAFIKVHKRRPQCFLSCPAKNKCGLRKMNLFFWSWTICTNFFSCSMLKRSISGSSRSQSSAITCVLELC